MNKEAIVHQLKMRWVSKAELQQMLGGVSERAAKSFIEDLNTELKGECLCVMSTARKAGYHIPNPFCKEDVELASGILAELKAKAVSIFEHRQAIEKFAMYATRVNAQPGGEIYQPTLF